MRIREATERDVAELAALYAGSVKALAPSAYSVEQVMAWAGFAENVEAFRRFVLEPQTIVMEDDSGTTHDYWRPSMKEYRPAKKRITVSVGESLRILRELQELSQNQLARLTGIPQTTISAIENDRVRLGVERAKVLARALKCHPGVLVFPGWEISGESAA
jgi:DNA-binding XRE family transcriptional regulator